MRKNIDFNAGWLFEQPEREPCLVCLPHTWNALDGQDGGNDYWRGKATYSKNFAAPDHDGCVFLEFAGAAMSADVEVNGVVLAHHDGGYSAFRVDITPVLKQENQVIVTVDNGANDRVYPQKADFTFYGGLYRDVSMVLVPKKHFELCQNGTPGIKVTPRVDPVARTAVVTVESWQVGEGTVVYTLAGQQCECVSGDGYAKAEFALENVRLWDGVDDPYLYTVSARFGQDEISARFGCRTMEFDPQKGFLLNGRSYPLRGVSRHQDRKGIGNALKKEHHREDIELIREMGANTVRLAHYQQDQYVYDLCDEYGIVVWAEIPYITQHMPAGRQNTLEQMRELISQCGNHPCIACWGLSNEISVHGVTEDLVENHRQLNELCHQMDSTRPTVMAHAFMLEQDSPLIPIADIASYNLYFGWYLGTLDQNDSFLDQYHEKYPERVMGFSEYGADANPCFQTPTPEKGDYSEQYQCLYHEHLLNTIEARPWLWASHAWNMFDFAADGRDEGGAHGLNQKGLVSFDRTLKKDAFYLYKAAWNKQEPFVHICGARYVHRVEEVTEIKVYSNAESISLIVDGQLLSTQKGCRVFRFQVELSGKHHIVAMSETARDEMTVEKVETPDLTYRMENAGDVANWFDESGFRSDCFSIRDSFGTLMAHPSSAAIVGALMKKMAASRGEVAESANKNATLQKMLAGMSLQALLKQAGNAVPPEMVKKINAELQKIKK